MGRLNKYLRAPLKPPAEADPALLAAARDALVALGEARREPTPSAVEGWIKDHRYEVWSSITTASALRDAIEAASRELAPARTESGKAKGGNGVAKKKVEKQEPPAEVSPPRTDPKPAAAKPSKPRAKPRPAEAPVAVIEEPLADVVRKAIESVGATAEDKKVKRWIARNYPDRDFKPTALSKAINAQRPSTNGVHEKPEKKAAPPPVKPKIVVSSTGGYDPTRTELLRVLGIAREQGGVTRLVKLVQAVKQLSDQVGGVERLAVCLEALEELGVK